MSSNLNAITRSEGNLKKMVTEESFEMKQAQQAILQEVISSKSTVKESGDNMLEQFGILNTNQEEMRGQLKEIGINKYAVTVIKGGIKYYICPSICTSQIGFRSLTLVCLKQII